MSCLQCGGPAEGDACRSCWGRMGHDEPDEVDQFQYELDTLTARVEAQAARIEELEGVLRRCSALSGYVKNVASRALQTRGEDDGE